MWIVAVECSRLGRFADRHDIREYSQRRNSPTVVLNVHLFSDGDVGPIFNGVPSPEPEAVFHRVVFAGVVDQHKPRISAVGIDVFGHNDNGCGLFGGFDVAEVKCR